MARKFSTEDKNQQADQYRVDEVWAETYQLGDVLIRKSKLSIGEIQQITSQTDNARPLAYTISGMEMYFNLGGDVHLSDDGVLDETLENMKHNLFATAQVGQFHLRFTGNPPYRAIRIIISARYLRTWYGKNIPFEGLALRLATARKTRLYPQPQSVNRAVFSVLHDMENCTLHGILKQRFLTIKVQELLILQLQQAEQLLSGHHQAGGYPIYADAKFRPAEQLTETAAGTLTASDRNTLHAAKIYMEENLDKSLSIVKLARQVGTNEFKLKRGFKLLFGTTVFHHLRHARMARARHLLLHGDEPLDEIPRMVGYTNLANFSNAFKAYHGYTPGTLIRRRYRPG